MSSSGKEKIYQAQAVAPGIAIGRVQVVSKSASGFVAPIDVPIKPEQIESELARFSAARERTRIEIETLRDRLKSKLNDEEAGIFDAHLLLVDDRSVVSGVEKLIREEHKSAEVAFFRVIERFSAAFEAIEDEYLRERAVDVRDVASRIMINLEEAEVSRQTEETDRRIMLAHDLTPSETAMLSRDRVLGFAVETGSSTSHTAILARSLQLPALVGIPHELLNLAAADKVILDGYSGRFIVNPDHRTVEAYRLKAEEVDRLFSDMLSERALVSETRDGFMVQLAANLEKVDGAATALNYGAHGVGLFRTEFLFLNEDESPGEDEQFEIYKKLLVAMDNRPVVVRTMDIGGDKLSGGFIRNFEQNPFLGLRGIRLCLKDFRDLFRTQLRALLRAGVFGNLRIMIPMLTCPEEIIEVKALIAEVQAELAAEKKDFVSHVPLGAMIETPAAALLADRFAELVDFMSIGTNDLVQYTMAIDRGNERVSYLYMPSHPAILELISRCVEAARENNIWVGVCGQMASDPRYVPLLMGLGVHELSMNPSSLGVVRRVIRSLTMHEAEAMTNEAVASGTADEALRLSCDLLRRVAPEVAELSVQ